MRHLFIGLTLLISLPLAPPTHAQAPGRINLVIVEGEGAINNIRQRTARAPIVQVEDENHKPVAGAVVVFTLPYQGAGGTFANSAQTLTMMSDSRGRAVARGLRPNNIQGQFEIHVNASFGGQTASTVITQTNALAAAAAAGGAAAAAGISGKLIAVIVIGAAAVAGGVVATTRNGGSSTASTPTVAPVTVTTGAGTVAPPR
jgi:hypothetical protein